MKKISIVGYGRFGQVLYRLLKSDFDVIVFDKKVIAHKDGLKIAENIKEVYKSEIIFIAVPIDEFENVISAHKSYFSDNHLLIDVLSVKMHPAKILTKHLKGLKTQAILTHPMFGPDSSKGGFSNLPIVLNRFLSNNNNFKFWKNYFTQKGLKVIEMSPQKHDKIAANSQGLTHFIGRLLDSFGLSPSEIDTLGTKKLLEVKNQTCNDTMQLFLNLQNYNSYTKEMRIKIGEKYDSLYNKLLPKAVNKNFVTYGIQGGRGSFNEEAAKYYFERETDKKYKIKFLYTSGAVLKALHEGSIDLGQFAIHNSLGGVVGESIEAMSKYKFNITDQFSIKISHALMIRSDATFGEVDSIMSHPQVFAQCQRTLDEKYPYLKRISGKGKLVDHALVAKRLSERTLGKNTAVMGSKILAQIYDLRIVEDNLQDAKENYTSFLVVERI